MEWMASDTLAREHLQLIRVTDDSMNEMKRPSDAGPKPRTQLIFLWGTKLGVHVRTGANLDLLRCTLSHIAASAPKLCDWLTCDVTNGAETHRNLDMPADNAIGLSTHRKQIHLAETVLDATNSEVAVPIEPLLNKTFGE